jgi:murein DD-endopeptidase MepM/ murein hydrolase activator NlpD
MQRIVNGEDPLSPEELEAQESSGQNGAARSLKDVHFSRSLEDSAFRKEVEKEERFNLSAPTQKKQDSRLENTFFFCPLKGMVVNAFDANKKHYGVDVVASPGAAVSAVMDGIVFFSDWTVGTGYVIQIQHSNNIISVYKHNEQLLKSIGDHVKSGEVIANVGNSGELTSGPHLHFELWYNGAALNPEEYISF